MLVPQHPRPVARRREVAEMTVAVRQAVAIGPGHVLEVVAAAPAVPASVRAGPSTRGATPPSPSERQPVSHFVDDTPV